MLNLATDQSQQTFEIPAEADRIMVRPMKADAVWWKLA